MRRIIAVITPPRERPNVAPVSSGLTENDGSWHRKGALTYTFTLGSHPRASFRGNYICGYTNVHVPTRVRLFFEHYSEELIGGSTGAPWARVPILRTRCKWRGKKIHVFVKRYFVIISTATNVDIINELYNVPHRKGSAGTPMSFPVASGTTMRTMRTQNACNMTVTRAGRPPEMAFRQF